MKNNTTTDSHMAIIIGMATVFFPDIRLMILIIPYKTKSKENITIVKIIISEYENRSDVRSISFMSAPPIFSTPTILSIMKRSTNIIAQLMRHSYHLYIVLEKTYTAMGGYKK